jgi:hypothetical protein
MLNWLIGPKAIGEWETRIIKKNWVVKKALNREVKLRLSRTFRDEAEEAKLISKIAFLKALQPHEETEKQRYYNTPRGFIYCVNTTTLYNEDSEWCNGCNNSQDCIETLKKNFPKIYNVRNNIDL